MLPLTDSTCHNCGEPIQWLKTKTGKMAPHDLEPRLHIIGCKKRPKKDTSSAVLALVSLGIKATEARELVKGLRGDDAAILVAALKRKDKGG